VVVLFTLCKSQEGAGAGKAGFCLGTMGYTVYPNLASG
jgi:hypothetical protein